ncbi:unnamed protein product [Rhizophagus irregularis]|uniref:Uncharacterized protein n=1 Tax=Rhizophagus irregularis TaxID=588596 RepID=A0A915YXX5_9GLOM|nr:unnamed protein product [Rhizophagus irregularis]
MLHNRFFGQVNDNIKQYLIPIILGKQRLQMNQSTDIDNEKICIGLQKQEQDIRQVLFKLLIKDVSQEIVLKVWYIRATGTSGIETLLQQIPAITLYSINNSNENLSITNSTFNHLFSIQSISCHSNSITKSNKTIYAELFELSRKVINSAIKADMY